MSKLNKFLAKFSVHGQVFCFNANSDSRRLRRMSASILSRLPLNYCDIGCRGGVTAEINKYKKYINFFGFDADPVAASGVEKQLQNDVFKSVKIYPNALGDDNKKSILNIIEQPGNSSLYSPSDEHIEFYGQAGWNVKEVSEVNICKFDNIYGINSDAIDIAKIDTQGSELNILNGGEVKLLGEALFMEIEVEFQQIYKDQPTYEDVGRVMRNNNFKILYLNRVSGIGYKWRRKYSKGILLFGDALFCKSRASLINFSIDRVCKLIVILSIYGFNDYAYSIFEDNKQRMDKEDIKIFEEYFEYKVNFISYWSSIFFVFIIDWIVFFLLKLRKWNHIRDDSDRSYPTR